MDKRPLPSYGAQRYQAALRHNIQAFKIAIHKEMDNVSNDKMRQGLADIILWVEENPDATKHEIKHYADRLALGKEFDKILERSLKKL